MRNQKITLLALPQETVKKSLRSQINYQKDRLSEALEWADSILKEIGETAGDAHGSSKDYLASAVLLDDCVRTFHRSATRIYEIEREIASLLSALRKFDAKTEEKAD